MMCESREASPPAGTAAKKLLANLTPDDYPQRLHARARVWHHVATVVQKALQVGFVRKMDASFPIQLSHTQPRGDPVWSSDLEAIRLPA